MRLLPLLLLSVLLMGQDDCNTEPVDPGYCEGTEGALNSAVDGVANSFNAIVGGNVSDDRRSTVIIRIHGEGSCTGVVLNDRTVLTAGHCIGSNGHTVFLDRNDYSKGQFLATGYKVHPGYYRWSYERTPPQDDIGLLFFEPGTLPGPYIEGFYESTGTRSCNYLINQGWGVTEKENSATPDPPDGYVREECPDPTSRCLREARYRVNVEEDSRLRGVQTTWGGSCFGDSGGPLYAQTDYGLKLAGITSTTASRDCLIGSTYVKAINYAPWIINNLPRNE